MMLALVNLAHFAQARAGARARDLAVRLALGAGRWRVARLLLAEAGVLAVAGGAAGILVCQMLFTWGLSRTPRFSHIYRLVPAGLDTRVVAFAIGLAAVAMLALALWPAIRTSRGDLRAALAAVPGARRRGWRVGGEALAIVGQTAFAVGLVVTCLLVVRSFAGLLSADRGYEPARVQLARVTVPDDGTPVSRAANYRQLIAGLNAVRGVEAAAAGNGVPGLTLPEGLADADGQPIADITAFQVSGQFTAAMAMQLEEGRLFDDHEAFGGAPVALVDRGAADTLWPGEPALGKTIWLRSGRSLVVVGVLRQVRARLFSEETTGGIALVSIDPASIRRLSVILRLDARRPPADAELAAAASNAVPGAAWNGTAGMSSWERLVGQPRFLASALGVLASLTVLLAGFGVLGVVSHVVSRRTREMGIRIALGADRARVRRLVIGLAVWPAAVGVTAGLVLAYWWSASVRAVVVGMSPHDPWSFSVAAVATLVTVLVATLKPASRASRVDPAHALREE
jgi:predicted permease